MSETRKNPWRELTAVRLSVGTTKTELAAKTHISIGHVCDLETGRREPTVQMLVKIAAALNVPLEAILKQDKFDSCEEAA